MLDLVELVDDVMAFAYHILNNKQIGLFCGCKVFWLGGLSSAMEILGYKITVNAIEFLI
jgi:hypothetical protein